MRRRAAAVLFAVAALATSAAAAPVLAQPRRGQPEDTGTTEARRHFETGAALFQARNYDGALAEFEESYRIRAVPVVLFNIAQTLKLLERYEEAIETYQRYLASDQ